MTKKKEVYKCEICGNVVEVLNEGAGTLVCCGQPMKLIKKFKRFLKTNKLKTSNS